MKKAVLLILVCSLLIGFIGCASAPTVPQYAENSEIPWNTFYSATQNNREFEQLPNSFFIEAFATDLFSGDLSRFITISNPENNNEVISIQWGMDFNTLREVRAGFIKRYESGKNYRLQIRKDTGSLIAINDIPITEIIAEIQLETREAEEARIAELREERQQPRFSPEGQEYVKRTLVQAVGESRNQANLGRTLFFETQNTRVRDSAVTGQYLVDEIGFSGNVLMEFYGRIPIDLVAGLLGGYGRTILYRVEISQAGVTRFVIDSFRE